MTTAEKVGFWFGLAIGVAAAALALGALIWAARLVWSSLL